MANSYQARATINAWLTANIVLATGHDPADRIAYQGIQGQQPTEWHISWDTEQEAETDQQFSRMFQLTRSRADGDENAFEAEAAALLVALGLNVPGRGATIPLYNYPEARTDAIGVCTVRRQSGRGWGYLPDPAGRTGVIRAAITLLVEYGP